MKLLLDTHAFLFWDGDPRRLSPDALALCQDPANTLLLSVASVWEMQIKSQLGKLRLGLPLAELIEGQRRANDVRLLPIELAHVLALEGLPTLHRDPFDRLIIAQATIEAAALISNNPVFKGYPVELIW